MCVAALGTDTGGSVRIPSALCGLVGLKPTLGVVPTAGMIHLSHTCDVIGPMTSCVADAATLFQCMGAVEASVAPLDWSSIRLGVPKDGYFCGEMDPDVRAAMAKTVAACRDKGATIVDLEHFEALDGIVPNGFATVLPESGFHFLDYMATVPGANPSDILAKLGPDVAGPIGSQIGESAQPIPGHAYLKAVRTYRDQLIAGFAQWHASVDAVLVPTTVIPAFNIAGEHKEDTFNTLVRHTFASNLTGLPSITIPMGRTKDNLPMGAMLIGKANDEAQLLSIAAKME